MLVLAPQPGIKPLSPELEDEVLTTRPPGKAPSVLSDRVRCLYFALCPLPLGRRFSRTGTCFISAFSVVFYSAYTQSLEQFGI